MDYIHKKQGFIMEEERTLMEKQRYYRRNVSIFVVLVLISSIFVGCANTSDKQGTAGQTTAAAVSETTAPETAAIMETETETEAPSAPAAALETDTDEKNRAYLAHYFDVDLAGKTIDAPLFTESLTKVAGDENAVLEGTFTPLWAVKAAVIAADYEELALSYPEAKVKDRLAVYGIADAVDPDYGAYLAAALDASLIHGTEGKRFADGEVMTEQEMVNLLMAVAAANGDARNYLGYSNDPQSASRLDNAWNSFLIFDDRELTELGKTAVEKGITTGYNLKTSAYDARFLPELTLQYGHDTIKHAHQLLALLNSENIVAKVQLEPKVSVYQYLLDWGPVPEPTPTYEVKQFGEDLYLVFAIEYDMMLEFDTEAEMLNFDGVIEAYAKKYEGNEDAAGLLASSWWQPLYSTTKETMPEENYHLIYDCVVSNGSYSIHPFCLPEALEQVTGQLKEIAPDQDINPVARYCNTAFYNYLNGDDYQ